MGRLTLRKGLNLAKIWLLPIAIVLIVFVIINSRISANPEPTRQELEGYLNGHALNIGVESVSGYQQVYYLYNDVKVFITNNQRNHTQPAISGRYVTWTETVEGFPQIVLYDLLDKTILQITQTGTNLSPSIWGNKIVWEGVNRGLQQVFYFDGTEIYQISHDSTSLRPKIQDNKIVYAQYTGKSGKEWQVVLYDLAEPAPGNRYKVIKEGGESDSWPSFVDGQIKTTID